MLTGQETTALKIKILEKTFALAVETKDWDKISMPMIADLCDMSLADLLSLFEKKEDILTFYNRKIDLQIIDIVDKSTFSDDPPRDRLFDILMERFEILNEDRPALTVILNAVTLNPKQIITGFPWLCQSMASMLELADISTDGWRGALRITGLSVLYLKVLRDWMSDESDDLSVTMASLDHVLNHAETIIQRADFLI